MDGTKTYVRSNGSTVNDNVTTYNYQVVDTRTGAKIPAAVGYSHLHFGIWNGLKKADALESTALRISASASSPG